MKSVCILSEIITNLKSTSHFLKHFENRFVVIGGDFNAKHDHHPVIDRSLVLHTLKAKNYYKHPQYTVLLCIWSETNILANREMKETSDNTPVLLTLSTIVIKKKKRNNKH